MSTELAVVNGDARQIEAAAPPAPQHFTIADMWQMSQAFAKSGMFGIRNPEQALSLLLIAQAEGIHPAKAMMEYHVIENKPSLKADAMLARHQRSGGKVSWIARADEKVTALFAGPLGEVEITWDKARAVKAGLWDKANFKKHPTQMLAARCISEGVRAVNPAAIQGFYAPEEVQFFEDSAPASPAEAPGADDRPSRWEGGERHDPREQPAAAAPAEPAPPAEELHQFVALEVTERPDKGDTLIRCLGAMVVIMPGQWLLPDQAELPCRITALATYKGKHQKQGVFMASKVDYVGEYTAPSQEA